MTLSTSAPSTLWYVDRSRIVDGRGFCNRARYLGYHSGPSGYGIQMKGTRVPLMTGIASHDGLAVVLHRSPFRSVERAPFDAPERRAP